MKQYKVEITKAALRDIQLRNYSYADDLSWHTVMDDVRVLYQTVYAERNGTHDKNVIN